MILRVLHIFNNHFLIFNLLINKVFYKEFFIIIIKYIIIIK